MTSSPAAGRATRSARTGDRRSCSLQWRDDHGLQLQVYADAGRREGLEVRGAYVHDLKVSERTTIDVGNDAVAAAEQQVLDAGDRLRKREFTPNPGTRCRRCDLRTVCGAAT